MTLDEVHACIKDFRMKDSAPYSSLVTMGVDVGKWIHVEINEWSASGALTADVNNRATPRILKATKVKDFHELDALMYKYGVNMCVIDANPETRKSLEFAKRFYGHVRMCYYANNQHGKNIRLGTSDNDLSVSVDRTSCLDLSLGRLHNSQILLPVDTPLEYKDHMQALIRITKLDKNENPVSSYIKEHNKADHYAHARNYSEIALAIVAGAGSNEDINE